MVLYYNLLVFKVLQFSPSGLNCSSVCQLVCPRPGGVSVGKTKRLRPAVSPSEAVLNHTGLTARLDIPQGEYSELLPLPDHLMPQLFGSVTREGTWRYQGRAVLCSCPGKKWICRGAICNYRTFQCFRRSVVQCRWLSTIHIVHCWEDQTFVLASSRGGIF